MPLVEIKPLIAEVLTRLWPDMDQSKVLIKAGESFIRNLFNPNAPSHQDEINAKSNVNILEGHCVQVLKPEIKIDVHGVIVTEEITKFMKVKVLKQKMFSHKQLPQALKKRLTRASESKLSLNFKILQNNEFIDALDFTKHVFHFEYPCVSNGIVNEFVKNYLLLGELMQKLQASYVD